MATEKTGLIPERGRVKEIQDFYYKTQKMIENELMKIDIADYKETKAIVVQNKINIIIDRLNRYAITWTKKSIPESYNDAGMKAKTSLSILGATRDKTFNTKIHKQAIDEFETATMDDLIRANISIRNNVAMFIYLSRQASRGLLQIQEFGIDDEAIIESIIAETMARSKARGYASTKIYEHLRLQALAGQFIERNGRNYNLRDYSKMVARTRMRECQTQSVKDYCKEYENDLVQFSQHSDPCPLCEPYEGEIYSLSGTNQNYPELPDSPPIHPNCEHDISPTSEVAIGFQEKFG